MKSFNFKAYLLTLIILTPLNILIADNEEPNFKLNTTNKDLLKIESEIEYRWEKAKKIKNLFAPYGQKSHKDIHKEFTEIKKLRKQLWYTHPKRSKTNNNRDYAASKKEKSSSLRAFNYNCVDRYFNASTILLYGHHFIALKEARTNNLDKFFKLLIEQDVALIVRLNPAKEYLRRHKYSYWEKHMLYEEELSQWLIEPKVIPTKKSDIPATPYFYTEHWKDNKSVPVEELYRLVQEVREIYSRTNKNGPIAVHCAAGIGRTGTFIAAYVLANLLDFLPPKDISIEALVLKLSIQRPNVVSVNAQYLVLYEFADYYLQQKRAKKTEKKSLEPLVQATWLTKSDFLVLGKKWNKKRH